MTRIVALGDSTSCGEGVGLGVPSCATWPARLAAATPGGELLPLAQPGARLRDVRIGQLPAARETRADVCTLLIGLNDISRSGFAAPAFRHELVEVVEELRSGSRLVLLGRLHDPTALLPLPARLRRVLRERAAAVNRAVDTCLDDDRVHPLDLAALPGLRMRRAWDVDRLHPNTAGHALIAEAAARTLRRAGLRFGPVRQQPLPPSPRVLDEARWAVRHGLPWLSAHLPEVVLPAVGALLRR